MVEQTSKRKLITGQNQQGCSPLHDHSAVFHFGQSEHLGNRASKNWPSGIHGALGKSQRCRRGSRHAKSAIRRSVVLMTSQIAQR